MKKVWTVACAGLAFIWIFPFSAMLISALVPMPNIPNIPESNPLYLFWYYPMLSMRENNYLGYLPSVIWIIACWIVGLIIIHIIQRILPSIKKRNA